MSDPHLAWQLTLVASILLLGGYVIHAFVSRNSMPASQQKLLQPTAFAIAAAGLILATALQILTLVGAIPLDKFDVFYLGLVAILIIAMYQFVRAVLDGVKTNAAGFDATEKESEQRAEALG